MLSRLLSRKQEKVPNEIILKKILFLNIGT